jgi:hypothetical protein
VSAVLIYGIGSQSNSRKIRNSKKPGKIARREEKSQGNNRNSRGTKKGGRNIREKTNRKIMKQQR